MGFDKCIISSINNYSFPQDSFTALKIPCVPPVHPFLLLPENLTFLLYHSCPFSVNIMSHSWNHTVSSLFKQTFLVRDINFSSLHVFFRSTSWGNLGCFYILTIINKAAMNLFSDISFANIFSLSVACIFIPLTALFRGTKIVNFNEVYLFSSFFHGLCLKCCT